MWLVFQPPKTTKKYEICPNTQQTSTFYSWNTLNFRAIWVKVIRHKKNRWNPKIQKNPRLKPKFAVWCSGEEWWKYDNIDDNGDKSNDNDSDLPHPRMESVNGDVHVFSLTKASQSSWSELYELYQNATWNYTSICSKVQERYSQGEDLYKQPFWYWNWSSCSKVT